jgi:hypothetical protein
MSCGTKSSKALRINEAVAIAKCHGVLGELEPGKGPRFGFG